MTRGISESTKPQKPQAQQAGLQQDNNPKFGRASHVEGQENRTDLNGKAKTSHNYSTLAAEAEKSGNNSDDYKYQIAVDLARQELANNTNVTDREFKKAIDANFDKLNPSVSGAHMRGDDNIIAMMKNGWDDITHGIGGGIDWLYDATIGEWTGSKDAFTGDDLALGVDILADVGLAALTPVTGGASLGVLAGKNAIQNSDLMWEAASGKDAVTIEDLAADQRVGRGAEALIGTAVSAIPGAGVGKNALKLGVRGAEKAGAKAAAKEATETAAKNADNVAIKGLLPEPSMSPAKLKAWQTKENALNALSGRKKAFVDQAKKAGDDLRLGGYDSALQAAAREELAAAKELPKGLERTEAKRAAREKLRASDGLIHPLDAMSDFKAGITGVTKDGVKLTPEKIYQRPLTDIEKQAVTNELEYAATHGGKEVMHPAASKASRFAKGVGNFMTPFGILAASDAAARVGDDGLKAIDPLSEGSFWRNWGDPDNPDLGNFGAMAALAFPIGGRRLARKSIGPSGRYGSGSAVLNAARYNAMQHHLDDYYDSGNADVLGDEYLLSALRNVNGGK